MLFLSFILSYNYSFNFCSIMYKFILFNAVSGTQWFHDRKLIGPTFHFSILDQFAVVLSEKAEIMTRCLEKEIEKNPGKAIDIFPFAINVALDIICGNVLHTHIYIHTYTYIHIYIYIYTFFFVI